MLLENIKMAFQAIFAYKLRSSLSALGIAIGVFSIILILTIMDGLKAFVHTQFSSMGGGGVYLQKTSFLITTWEEWIEQNKRRDIKLSDYIRLKQSKI
mgnify:CR=1 FL=1